MGGLTNYLDEVHKVGGKSAFEENNMSEEAKGQCEESLTNTHRRNAGLPDLGVNKRIAEQEQDWLDAHCYSRNFLEATKAWAEWFTYKEEVNIKRMNRPLLTSQQTKRDRLFTVMRERMIALSLAEQKVFRNIRDAAER